MPQLTDMICLNCTILDLRYFSPGEECFCPECGGLMAPEFDFLHKPHLRPTQEITIRWLVEQRACRAGRFWFIRNFPLGCSYGQVIKKLRWEGLWAWEIWLKNHFERTTD